MTKRTMDVVKYNKNWIKLFEVEKSLIAKIFKYNIISIEHFGSTSVPHLSAKPIIDILVLVHDINVVNDYNIIMEEQGYTARGEHGMKGRRMFVKYKEDLVNHTHHVHVYQIEGNPFIKDAILFRDFLRINEDARVMYEKTKIELSEKFYYEPLEYTNGKHECVSEILKMAKEYFDH